jgi:hypothetical protein
VKLKLNAPLLTTALATCLFATGAQSTGLSINGSNPVATTANIDYDLANNRFDVSVAEPFFCTNFGTSNLPLVLRIFDPNNESPADLTGLQSIQYDVTTNSLNIIGDATLVCMDVSGTVSGGNGNGDIIFAHGFEPAGNAPNSDITVNYSASNNTVAAGFNFVYHIVATNNGTDLAHFNLNDFFPKTSQFDPALGSGTWSCSVVAGSSANASCGSNISGTDVVDVLDAVLDAGDSIDVTVTRPVINNSAALPQTLTLNAAALVAPQYTDSQLSNNVDSFSLNVVANQPPTITAIADQSILEDNSTPAVPFTIGDVETAVTCLGNVTASSSDTAIIPVSGIAIADTGNGTDCTVTVTPATNANGTANVTLTVDDGTTAIGTSFAVSITPVNDKPAFSVNPTVIVDGPYAPAGNGNNATAGAQPKPNSVLPTFATVDTFGATDEDNSQQVQAYTVTVVSDPNGVIALDGFTNEPIISLATDGTLSYALSGAFGTATFEAVLQDNGGTTNGGQDTSDPVPFSIEVPAPNPSLTLDKTVYGSWDAGAGCASAGENVSNVAGAVITYCFKVTNTGDVHLDINTLDDTDLALSLNDLTLIGNPALPLAPGASATWYYQTTINGTLTNHANTAGTPVDANNTPLGFPDATATDTANVTQL